MKNKIRFMVMMAVTVIIAFSCENESVDAVYDGDGAGQLANIDSRGFVRLLDAECDSCYCEGNVSDSIWGDTLSALAPPFFFEYCPWNPVAYQLCEPYGPSIQFEGQFNSFVRPQDDCWYIGVVDPDDATSWCSILENMTPKSGNEGTDPTCHGGPNNVVGLDGEFPPYDFGLGYYSYDITGQPNIDQCIVLYKDCDVPCSDDPEEADIMYLLCIKDIISIPIVSGSDTTHWTSKVIFDYECIEKEDCD